MVIEIIVNAIDDYCLLLSLFFHFTRLSLFLDVYFSRQARLLWSTFFHFTCVRVYFLTLRKRRKKATFWYVATMALLYLWIE